MEPSDDQTLYEVLEVPANAAFRDIQKAYSEILSIYDADALSTYSLFTAPQRDAIINRAKKAFQVLMDPDKRHAYDQSLVDAEKLDPSDRFEKKDKTPMPVFQTAGAVFSGQVEKTVKKRLNNVNIRELKKALMEKTSVSGADLKNLREAANVSLSEIFEVSRVSVPVLDAIENDRKDRLPSMMHLKGFLKSYADFLDLDAAVIIPAYLNHLKGVTG